MIQEAGRFELCGVVHLVRPVGVEAHDLEELRLALKEVPDRSLFFHTVARMLRHPASAELPQDDISAWVSGVVQDRQAAERMSFAVETNVGSAAELRAALIQVLEDLPEKQRVEHDAPPSGEFVFLTSESVPVPSGAEPWDAGELIEQLAAADSSVWFYHLIEQTWFEPESNTLTGWLRARNEKRLAEWFEQGARSGRSIEEIRQRLMRRWRLTRIGQRVADAARSPDNERREAGREAITNLVRRISQSEGDE